MLVTGRGEEGGNQSKPREGGIQYGESTRRKTGAGAGKEVQGESKAKAGNQQGAPGGGSQQVEGGGACPAAAGGSGGSDQVQENGNRWVSPSPSH